MVGNVPALRTSPATPAFNRNGCATIWPTDTSKSANNKRADSAPADAYRPEFVRAKVPFERAARAGAVIRQGLRGP